MYRVYLFCDKLGENLVKDCVDNLINIFCINMRMFVFILVKGLCIEIGLRKWVYLY